MSSEEYQLIFVTETWFDDSVPSSLFLTPQYRIHRLDMRRRGGGVAAIYSSRLTVSPVPLPSGFDDCEVVAIDILGSNAKRVVCAYRSPSLSDEGNLLFVSALQHACATSSPVCVIGDFNLPDFNWSTFGFPATQLYQRFAYDFVLYFGLSQHISEPTRGGAVLDLLFSNDSTLVSDWEVCLPFASSCDHDAIRFSLNHWPTPAPPSGQEVRLWSRADWASAAQFLSRVPWQALLASSPTADDQYMTILSVLRVVVEQFVPTAKIGSRKYPKHIRRLLLRKRRSWRPSFGSNRDARNRYRLLSKRCEQAIRKHNDSVERDVLLSGSISRFYRYVRRRKSASDTVPPLRRFDGTTATTCSDKAQVLNNFFASVFLPDDGHLPDFALRRIGCNDRSSRIPTVGRVSYLTPFEQVY